MTCSASCLLGVSKRLCRHTIQHSACTTVTGWLFKVTLCSVYLVLIVLSRLFAACCTPASLHTALVQASRQPTRYSPPRRKVPLTRRRPQPAARRQQNGETAQHSPQDRAATAALPQGMAAGVASRILHTVTKVLRVSSSGMEDHCRAELGQDPNNAYAF